MARGAWCPAMGVSVGSPGCRTSAGGSAGPKNVGVEWCHFQFPYYIYTRERRACQALTFGRSTYRYESVAAEQAALRMRIRGLASARVSYGYRRIHVLLKREGWQVNHKRVYRLYCWRGSGCGPRDPGATYPVGGESRPLASRC